MSSPKVNFNHIYVGIFNFIPLVNNPTAKIIIQRDVYFLKHLINTYQYSDVMYLTLTKEEGKYAAEYFEANYSNRIFIFKSLKEDYYPDYEAITSIINIEYMSNFRKSDNFPDLEKCYFTKEGRQVGQAILEDYFTSKFNLENEIGKEFGHDQHLDMNINFLARSITSKKNYLGKGLLNLNHL